MSSRRDANALAKSLTMELPATGGAGFLGSAARSTFFNDRPRRMASNKSSRPPLAGVVVVAGASLGVAGVVLVAMTGCFLGVIIGGGGGGLQQTCETKIILTVEEDRPSLEGQSLALQSLVQE